MWQSRTIYRHKKNWRGDKINVFEEKTGTKKQIFLTLITTMGLKKNIYSEDLVHSEEVLKDLFD